VNLPELQNLQAFEVSVENYVAHLQLKRPDEFNSMNSAFWTELPSIVRALDNSTEVRVIVLSSTGKHFTAGMDLGVFANIGGRFEAEEARRAEALRRLVLELQDSFNVLEQARMPVLSAVQGGCIGGGVDMICASDSRYCTEDSFFVVKETQLGIVADLGTLQRLPKLIPEGLARELAYTSRKMLAQEALTAGFVNAVYPDQASMLEAVMAIARTIAANSPLTVSGTKTMFNYSLDHGVSDSLNYMATWQAGMFRTADLQEAMTAAGEKREAKFLPLEKLDIDI
jgi:enoyl-CoA hydratase